MFVFTNKKEQNSKIKITKKVIMDSVVDAISVTGDQTLSPEGLKFLKSYVDELLKDGLTLLNYLNDDGEEALNEYGDEIEDTTDQLIFALSYIDKKLDKYKVEL